MRRGASLSPAWVAVSLGAASLVATGVRYVRPVQAPAVAAEPRSSDHSGPPVPVWPAARDGDGPPTAPDPFRRGDGTAALPDDLARESESDPDPSYAELTPRIVGVGRRADGMAFVGCALPGEGTTIVRQGSFCGTLRLIEVVNDSARFANDASGTVLTLGVGGGRR